MTAAGQAEPEFFVQNYITITRDQHTQLVVAIGGGERAAAILQSAGDFIPAPGPHGLYHRLPHSLPANQQRWSAIDAAEALRHAGFSVHLDDDLVPDGDRLAAQRHFHRLSARGEQAADDREVAALLTEITTPLGGPLANLTSTLVVTQSAWAQRMKNAGRDGELPDRLRHTAQALAATSQLIRGIRDQAAPPRPAAKTAPEQAPAAAVPGPAAPPPPRRR
ncbi:hypothetical protein ACIBK8_25690 [Streptomyces sp. NPDC050161]|uniref:hypothetical protein n=1 Tax=Streptomyces sp. NPDC050161 TaxID=3365604 RepID=UPI00379F160A